MRTELGKYNSGTPAEVRFFLERADETGQFFYLQASPRGERRLQLESAVQQPFYRQAVELARAMKLKAAL
ncbi:MAG: hypothetical protein EOP36_01330 [Rubrivivax sp.]|nr:MAG: hypothetical protein EOP36_01330 [Rubrivivax sp.]